VRDQCLDYALSDADARAWGVWGDTTPRQPRVMGVRQPGALAKTFDVLPVGYMKLILQQGVEGDRRVVNGARGDPTGGQMGASPPTP
jgi:hypothetical protein